MFHINSLFRKHVLVDLLYYAIKRTRIQHDSYAIGKAVELVNNWCSLSIEAARTKVTA